MLPGENSAKAAVHLKSFIDSSHIDGLEKTTIDSSPNLPGQMGAGELLGRITTIIEAAEKPLVALIECLKEYVTRYRTEITIETPNGKFKVKRGKMSTEEMQNVVAIFNKK